MGFTTRVDVVWGSGDCTKVERPDGSSSSSPWIKSDEGKRIRGPELALMLLDEGRLAAPSSTPPSPSTPVCGWCCSAFRLFLLGRMNLSTACLPSCCNPS